VHTSETQGEQILLLILNILLNDTTSTTLVSTKNQRSLYKTISIYCLLK